MSSAHATMRNRRPERILRNGTALVTLFIAMDAFAPADRLPQAIELKATEVRQ